MNDNKLREALQNLLGIWERSFDNLEQIRPRNSLQQAYYEGQVDMLLTCRSQLRLRLQWDNHDQYGDCRIVLKNFNDIHKHIGHDIECVWYGMPIQNIALECTTCHEVLMDFDLEDDDEQDRSE